MKTNSNLTKEQKSTINRIKSLFQTYFNGTYGVEPISQIPLSTLEITNLEFNLGKDETKVHVTLGRPGLLIGKGGQTIDAVEKYLSTADQKVKIYIIESKLWSFID